MRVVTSNRASLWKLESFAKHDGCSSAVPKFSVICPRLPLSYAVFSLQAVQLQTH